MDGDIDLDPEAAAGVRHAIIDGSARLQEIERDIAAASLDDPAQPGRASEAERTVGELDAILRSDVDDSARGATRPLKPGLLADTEHGVRPGPEDASSSAMGVARRSRSQAQSGPGRLGE